MFPTNQAILRHRHRHLSGAKISSFSEDSGSATAAALKDPSGLALTTSGDLLIVDSANHRIRMVCMCAALNHSKLRIVIGFIMWTMFSQVNSVAVIKTIAGTGTGAFSDGAATTAQLNFPSNVAVAPNGNTLKQN